MSSDYVAPDPEMANFVARSNAECDHARERLKDARVSEMKQVFRNKTESNAVRCEALLELFSSRDPELDDLLLELFDDPDQQLWQTAFTCYCSKDARILKRLADLLDDPDDEKWSTAAVALARVGDESLSPRLVEWLRTGDEAHRNVAVESLKMLRKPSATAALSDFWDQGLGDEETRWVVAAALFDLGDARGRLMLESLARRCEGSWSVFAATSIY